MKVICTPNTQRLPHWEAFFFYTTRRKPLEVKINKEIQSYSESMFFGLSMRQCGFSLAAMLVAVGLYFLLKPYVGTETVSWMCILGAAPFAAMGFMNYHGMTAEQFVWAWFRSEDVDAARSFFARVEADLSAHFAALGSTCGPMNAMERLQILHRFYRRGEKMSSASLSGILPGRVTASGTTSARIPWNGTATISRLGNGTPGYCTSRTTPATYRRGQFQGYV